MKNKILIIKIIAIIIIILLAYIVVSKNDKRVEISDLASMNLESEWNIDMIETKDGYSYFYLLYKGIKVATLEFSEVNEMSLISKNTTAESFTRLYIGMHAELEESNTLATKRGHTQITKLVVNPGMSAAESVINDTEYTDEVWYFGISENNIMMCAQLLNVNAEEIFEKVLSTLLY